MSRVLASLLAAALLLVGGAAPVLADPAVPTNYLSVITDVTPDLPELETAVLGGDAFIEFTWTGDVELFVLGEGRGEIPPEPVLRFAPDGIVSANIRSPYWYLIEDRYAAVEIPDIADPAAAPAWEIVSTNGTYVWHEHRIHWMSPQPPPSVRERPGEVVEVFDWSVPIRIGDQEGAITGTLRWFPSDSPVWPVVALLFVLVVGMLARLLPARSRVVAAVAAMAGGLLATAVGFGEVSAGLVDATGSFVGLGLAGAAAVLGLVAVVTVRQRPDDVARLIYAASALVVAFTVPRFGVFTKPELPTALSTTSARVLLAAALGAALGGAVALLMGRGSDRAPAASPTAAGGDTEASGPSPGDATDTRPRRRSRTRDLLAELDGADDQPPT